MDLTDFGTWSPDFWFDLSPSIATYKRIGKRKVVTAIQDQVNRFGKKLYDTLCRKATAALNLSAPAFTTAKNPGSLFNLPKGKLVYLHYVCTVVAAEHNEELLKQREALLDQLILLPGPNR